MDNSAQLAPLDALANYALDSRYASSPDIPPPQPLEEDVAIGRRLMLGERVADGMAATVGSWRFIIVQTVLLACWIAVNVRGWMGEWDPYPFILLNLILSFQAAYTAPIIMMSQNRQAEADRFNAENDYRVNVQSEVAIGELHRKLDGLRDCELKELSRLLTALDQRLAAMEHLTETARS